MSKNSIRRPVRIKRNRFGNTIVNELHSPWSELLEMFSSVIFESSDDEGEMKKIEANGNTKKPIGVLSAFTYE